MASPQKRVQLKGSTRAVLPAGQDAGPADPNQQIEVTVLLRRGSSSSEFPSLAELSARLPGERKYLSREEFARLHGASEADLEKVRMVAKEHNLKVVRENRGSRVVKLSGTVQSFNSAFGVELRRYEHSSGTFRCRTGGITIPADLEAIIDGVFGLDSRPQTKPHFRLGKKKPNVDAQAAAVSYSPRQVAQAYGFPSDATGVGQCIGLIELGGGYRSTDLDSFFRDLGISTPKVTAVSVDGAANSPTGDPAGPDGEVELDIQVAGAIAPEAQIAVYFAPNTDQGFIDAIKTAVHDANLKPSIISISWGAPESSWTEQSRNALNAACQDASAMGVTVLAASGDNGASDGTADGTPTVDFPAASPYVIGCGGTKLTISGAGIGSEIVWYELSMNEGATGGGVSKTFALPSYQKAVNVP